MNTMSLGVKAYIVYILYGFINILFKIWKIFYPKPETLTFIYIVFLMSLQYSYAEEELPAMKGIRVFNLTLHPYIDTSVVYDDNIWSRAPSREVDDIITKLKPGLIIEVPYYKHSLKMDAYAKKVTIKGITLIFLR